MHNETIGIGCQPITLFQGEDYPLIVMVGNEGQVGFGWFGSHIVHSVGHFASNVVKTAGKAVGTVTKPIQSVTGAITKEIGKIPIVGGPLHAVFDVTFHIAMGPTNMIVAVASGQRIDHVVLNNLKQQLHDFKQVAPYAQMVISIVPGVGQGVSAALSAGLALSEGQPIDAVLKAGLIGALPGGPLVKAAVTMGVETIQHVAKGEKLNLQTFEHTAGGIASSALGLPIAAKNALVTGIAIIGGIAHGNPLDKAVSDAAIHALPLSDAVKKAMIDASALSLDLAHGKKVDAAFTAHVTALAAVLPPTNPLHDSIKSGLDSTRKIQGKNEDIMLASLQSGLADTLVSMGAQPLPVATKNAIKSGLALGSGVVYQSHRGIHLGKVTGKLVESGVQLSKTSPLFAEARKLAAAKNATKGFDLATGLLQQQVGAFDVAKARDSLDPVQKLGFDIACSVRVGAVANPKPPNISAAAHAGHAITLGMQSYTPEKKAVMMQTVQSNPSATVGATVAVKEVVANRESIIIKILKALHLHK
ncbi:Uncharacterised protein [uncultured archaeon]|nr:Uncharacterised protein [uncultured archaeon]